MPGDTIKKPTFFLEETIIQPMEIVYIKDTALMNALSKTFDGPYENLGIVYTALTQWINEHGRHARGLPFEIYLNDPKTVNDKYALQTDIVQLIY